MRTARRMTTFSLLAFKIVCLSVARFWHFCDMLRPTKHVCNTVQSGRAHQGYSRPSWLKNRPDCAGPKVSIKSLIFLTLSAGVIVACGPPISVSTQPGLTTTQVMPRGARSIARLRVTMFTAAFELR